MNLSIVIPIYNEEENVRALYSELVESLSTQPLTYELIFVDDGSSDRSLELIKTIALGDAAVKVVALRRNFGQTAAMTAGFDVATGDVVIPMDGDLQNDPADIPRLVEKIREGFDVVSGWRKDRKDKFVTRKIPSMLANGLISRITGVHLHDYGCTLKAYRKNVIELVNLYGELHRFVPALASLVGANVVEIPVNHRPRNAGSSKYGIDRTMRVVLDLVTVKFLLKYATRPMQLFGKWGLSSLFFAGLSGVVTLYMKFAEGLGMNRNPLLILTAVLIFIGIQFVAIGLLGELVTRTYHEIQGKKIYTVKETVNIERG